VSRNSSTSAGLVAAVLALGVGGCPKPAPPETPLPAALVLGPVVKTRLAELRAKVKETPLPPAADVSALIAKLGEADPAARRATEDALVAAGPGAIPALAAALADTTLADAARGTAALALGRLDHDAAVAPLVAALRDRSRYVRAFVSMALGTLGRDEAVTELLFRFKEEYEPEGVVVNAAAKSLLGFGNVGGLDRLVKNLRARQLEREDAIVLLKEIVGTDRGFDPSGAELDRRVKATEWEDWLAFEAPAFLLARPAPPEPSDRLALKIVETVDRLREYQMRTIDDARLVLERLGVTAVPFLRLGLRDEEAKIRGYALEVTTLLGPRARDATPEILGLLRDEMLAPFAYQALGAVAAKEDALPLLLRGLADPRTEVRIACAAGLGLQGDPAAGLEPLKKLLASKGRLPADLELAADVASGALGDLPAFGRALDLAEASGAIDPDVAVRTVEDALARASRRFGGGRSPFRPAGAASPGVPSGTSHARPDPTAAAASASGAQNPQPPADGVRVPVTAGATPPPPDRATRVAAIRAYLGG